MTETGPLLSEVTLEKIRFAVTKHVFPLDLRYEVFPDYMTDRMTHLLNWNLLGKKIETKTYPSTWWDGFKNKYFPSWLKKRYPPNFDEFKLYNICPHINYKWPEHADRHITWLEKDHGFNSSSTDKGDQVD